MKKGIKQIRVVQQTQNSSTDSKFIHKAQQIFIPGYFFLNFRIFMFIYKYPHISVQRNVPRETLFLLTSLNWRPGSIVAQTVDREGIRPEAHEPSGPLAGQEGLSMELGSSSMSHSPVFLNISQDRHLCFLRVPKAV